MPNILLLGGTGKTGRRIAQRLRTADTSVRAASRGGDTPLDLADPESWKAALDGITAAYLVEPVLQAAGENRIPRFATEAVAAGARRLVLLSAPRADEPEHPLHAAEEAVRGSGVDWTILRPDWFCQNFSESYWRPGILSGALPLPTGDGRTPFVDAEDIAEVAASALTEDRHHGRTYHLTGPRALSVGEAVELIGAACGRSVRHVDVDPGEFVQRQIANGVPAAVARLLTGLFVDIREGRGSAPTDDVTRALGRPPRSFEEYVADAWSSAEFRSGAE